MKKILLILLLLNLISPEVYALARCHYDYNENKVCKSIPPEEIHAARTFYRVDMFDERGRRVNLYLKKNKTVTRVINCYKAYIGSGFEDRRGNIHIVEKGKIVKSFYISKI